jgi:peptidoglycan hydrolase CwlO-like protein
MGIVMNDLKVKVYDLLKEREKLQIEVQKLDTQIKEIVQKINSKEK